MSEQPQDPAQPSDSDSSLTDLTQDSVSPPRVKAHPRQPKLFVEPPHLTAAEKSLYKGLPNDFQPALVLKEKHIDSVTGDRVEKGKHYYFVRLEDGTTRKFPAIAFMTRYPDFVKAYERDKIQGKRAPIDSSDVSVYHASRITSATGIRKSRTVSTKSSDDSRSDGHGVLTSEAQDVSDTDADDVPESSSDSESDEYGQRPAVFRRKKALPFSPKRLRIRHQKPAVPDSEDELAGYTQDTISDTEHAPLRRSTRARKTVQHDVSAYDDEEDEEDEEAYTGQKPKTTKKKARPVASRPAYGHFRPIQDLDYDEDPDTAALRAHRDLCEKCFKDPAHILLQKYNKRMNNKGRQRQRASDDEDDGEKITSKGGWVRCLKCPVVAHWACLASDQREEILKAARVRDREIWLKSQQQADAAVVDQAPTAATAAAEPKKRPGLDCSESTEFICTACLRGGICMGCTEVALEPDKNYLMKKGLILSTAQDNRIPTLESGTRSEDVEMADTTSSKLVSEEPAGELLFRCVTCKRLAHYSHLPVPLELGGKDSSLDAVTLAEHYQAATKWNCADCTSFRYKVDKILAWRPYPPNAVQPSYGPNELPDMKSQLPREYLVKWVDRSYRRVQWVPHMWLVTRSYSMLKQFSINGPRVEMLPKPFAQGQTTPAETSAPVFEIAEESSREASVKPAIVPNLPSGPSLDAEQRIMPAWKTVDRVLDVLLWSPQKRASKKAKKARRGRNDSNDAAMLEDDPLLQAEYTAAFEEGEQPSEDLTETIGEFEARVRREITAEDIDSVIWAFIKWDDQGYDESTWDSPPRPGEFGYAAFKGGFERFIASRSVVVPTRTGESMALVANRPTGGYKKYALKDDEQPQLGQASHLKLMSFQIDGFNWLCNNWWTLQHCILADEMGLGKTVQIAAFLGHIMRRWETWPALVVVPNSTITNWVREFSKWAPALRVVPYYGGAKGRSIVQKYELYHDEPAEGTTGAKFHVLVTTYETVTTAKESAAVFKNAPRWEVLIVDEGQRLKSDSSLLFKKLRELNSIHRIIMTGTPLNNNIRELFNLMNFLDPNEWDDLEVLEKEHEVLTEELVKQLHNRLRPYFLRRVKSEVLQLPPKNEVIVPLSMSPLQKNVYRSILSKNFEVLKSLTDESKSRFKNAGIKTNIKNVLMQLRKCLQHPYTNDRAIEPANLTPEEAHNKLIDASAKLRFLKSFLAKLKARGHRVLLFSQFVMALDIVEDFLSGEGYKFLRLDGNTPQAERQKGMDEFNRPGSDVFIYILSTRAGGVGINLWSADTVIIHDPDFNPHQDLQAIARAHRYGQTKTCLVFKLIVKDSAEERIIQTGKKKLVLDHLIVQKMDDDDESNGENLKSILTYGAQALFEDDHDAKDITYTDADMENLIEKTEKEEPKEEASKEGLISFSFAKVWAADKDALEEVADEIPQGQEQDSWAHTLQRIEAEAAKEKTQEITGRGVRRKAAAVFPHSTDTSESPVKEGPKKKKGRRSKSKSLNSDSDAYIDSIAGSVSDGSTSNFAVEQEMLELDSAPLSKSPAQILFEACTQYRQGTSTTTTPVVDQRHRDEPPAPVQKTALPDNTQYINERCGLCFSSHPRGRCPMTNTSEYLAEYRRLIIMHSGHEPMEQRRAAIRAIDETLNRRGKLHLIAGQPLAIVDKSSATTSVQGSSTAVKDKVQRERHVGTPKFSHYVKPMASKGPKATYERLAEKSVLQGANAVEQPIAGPSKRASSPMSRDPETFKKKVKPCKLGCGAPKHPQLEDCPVVKAGPALVSRAITKFESDPKMDRYVGKLRKILKEQQMKEKHNSPPEFIIVEE